MANELPAMMGTGSLLGRPAVRPANDDVERPVGYDENGQPIYELVESPAPAAAIPAVCLRVLNSPLPLGFGGGCPLDCPGRQEDGGCLCDVVRAANERGVEWGFEIDERTGIWKYVGPPLG